MKTKKVTGKLVLGKKTIANVDQMNKVKGGTGDGCWEPTIIHKTCYTCNTCDCTPDSCWVHCPY